MGKLVKNHNKFCHRPVLGILLVVLSHGSLWKGTSSQVWVQISAVVLSIIIHCFGCSLMEYSLTKMIFYHRSYADRLLFLWFVYAAKHFYLTSLLISRYAVTPTKPTLVNSKALFGIFDPSKRKHNILYYFEDGRTRVVLRNLRSILYGLFLPQGNFVNRALKFCKENFGGKVEEVKLSSEKGDDDVIALVNRYLASYVDQVRLAFPIQDLPVFRAHEPSYVKACGFELDSWSCM